ENARSELLLDGMDEQLLAAPRRAFDLRYSGQDSTIEVEATLDHCREAFEKAHERRYGFTHPGRELELVTARVTCSAGIGEERFEEGSAPSSPTETPGSRRAFFAGAWVDVAVFDEASLEQGASVAGPAIIASAYHTIVVAPGWTAARHPSGHLVLERMDKPGVSSACDAAGEPDPVQLEIFHLHFASIAEEMGVALENSAVSTNVRERLDFSCAVFDSGGGLVANAPHIPVHLGAMGECVRQVSRRVSDLAPGDVIVTNDPFLGGSHLPDVTVVTPVFDAETAELLFYTASRAHHAEIGGRRPGSMAPDSKNLSEEGVLLRNFKVIEAGVPRFDELEKILLAGPWPSRCPRENLADIEAQVAANRAGARRLEELITVRGRATVLGYMAHIQAAARRLMESHLDRLSRGTRTFEDELDDGTKIALRMEVGESRALLDFTGTAGVLDNNFNATPAIVSSAVLYCFRCLIDNDIPLNAGVLEPLELILPESFLNPPPASDPAECAAVAAGNVETSQRLVDVVLGALGVAAASQGTMNNLLFGNESFGYYETIAGGAGAGEGFPGAAGVHTHMTNTRITDPEVLERRYPVRLHRFSLRAGSGGVGSFPGGDGVIRELEFLEEVEVSILSQRRARGPYGAAGGSPGEPGKNLLLRRGAKEWEELPAVTTFSARVGDRLRIETPGGGGWGAPQGD
ncbi:MAG: hydantoinase B/oxoprolinase family protein, partial [Planctomycetota bacterium]|nr:hydantoinase B/oxoprolinase family protein [Planctomycetota bacterium]